MTMEAGWRDEVTGQGTSGATKCQEGQGRILTWSLRGTGVLQLDF